MSLLALAPAVILLLVVIIPEVPAGVAGEPPEAIELAEVGASVFGGAAQPLFRPDQTKRSI